MGEIAAMMLDGTLCQSCGEFIGLDGYPSYCRSCSEDMHSTAPAVHKPAGRTMPPVTCPDCGKRVKMTGIADHWRAVHGAADRENERE